MSGLQHAVTNDPVESVAPCCISIPPSLVPLHDVEDTVNPVGQDPVRLIGAVLVGKKTSETAEDSCGTSDVEVCETGSDLDTTVGDASSCDGATRPSLTDACPRETEGFCWSKDAPKLVVLDWDDTLLPTTWLVKEKILMAPPNASRSVGTAQRRMTPEHRAELAALEAAAHELLDAAELLGKVIIVTNAITTWVEKSGHALVPSLASRIAARYPVFARPFGMKLADMTSWKTYAFDREAEAYGTILSVGDGPDERGACLTLPYRRVRSIKLLEDPSAEDLRTQQVFVAQRLADVASDARSVLDLETRRASDCWQLVCVSKPVHSLRHTLSMTPIADTRIAPAGWDATQSAVEPRHQAKRSVLRSALFGCRRA
jgi:hypothetical protein